MPTLDLTLDELLTTTRAVRKRLDLERPVELEVIKECLEIAQQAPCGGNSPRWHFVVVTDADKRAALAELYRRQMREYFDSPPAAHNVDSPQQQLFLESAKYLTEHLHEVPVHVIPCLKGRESRALKGIHASMWAALFPAVWNYMLAARARGLGTCLTTAHLVYERDAAEVLGIPYDEVIQGALIPTAYTIGTEFKPARRPPLEDVLHLNGWQG